MKTIKVDDEVWELLKQVAVPLEDEPNDALRRLLKMPDQKTGAGGSDVLPAALSPAVGQGKNNSPAARSRFDRAKIEETIVQIIKERGGQTQVKDPVSGFNIYEEVGDRLGLSRQTRRELTPAGENRWRAEVGFARKNLEQRGIILPTRQSGRGLWRLK